MKIILTHEQADFDALASLLGASLLDEQARPVLPRRLNRNVRAFLTLYGLELPFIEPQDLPKTKISTITLVDTQSMITLKGVDNQVYAIAHGHRALGDGVDLSVGASQRRHQQDPTRQAACIAHRPHVYVDARSGPREGR